MDKSFIQFFSRNKDKFKTKSHLEYQNVCLISLQLSELEQRVIEAEGRAEEAEDKVTENFIHCFNYTDLSIATLGRSFQISVRFRRRT